MPRAEEGRNLKCGTGYWGRSSLAFGAPQTHSADCHTFYTRGHLSLCGSGLQTLNQPRPSRCHSYLPQALFTSCLPLYLHVLIFSTGCELLEGLLSLRFILQMISPLSINFYGIAEFQIIKNHKHSILMVPYDIIDHNWMIWMDGWTDGWKDG